MVIENGYQVLETIHQGQNSNVYKVERPSGKGVAAVKTYAGMILSGAHLATLSREFTMLDSIAVNGVPAAYELADKGRSVALVMEYFPYPSLRQLLAARRLTIFETVTLFGNLAGILEEVHKNGIAHRDITPGNILFDRKTGDTALIDFGTAMDIPLQSQEGVEPESVAGTIAYMSPEQTGRINRSLDFRTDIYSLGVTMYRAVTGRLPFESDDVSEVIHAHIAVLPVPPAEVDPDIPEALSDIMMTCMAKDAGDRYQSAHGLKADLDRCLRELEDTGDISRFPVGRSDLNDRFLFPERIFGREKALAALKDLYGAAGQGRAPVVMVSGYSGVGKTSLVRELNRKAAEEKGYVIQGKYDQYNRNTPYSGLVKAFAFLIKQILTESDTRIGMWRDKILAAVGDNGQVLTDVIPELETLIGRQPPATPLEPAEAGTRFGSVFTDFMAVFSDPAHPLVLFLDDLQWIDTSSLSLVERMGMAGDSSAILFIGAYRSNEVSESHPLSTSIAGMKKSGANVVDLPLEPLDRDTVCRFLAEMFHREGDDVAALARTAYAKTEGNPLFFRTFLSALYEKGHITYDYGKQQWVWDQAAIAAAPFADNVLEAIGSRIRTFPADTVDILKLGALAGTAFSLDFLSRLSGVSRMAAAVKLKPAVARGLITSTRKRFDLYTQKHADKLEGISFGFSHDRIQQAAYAMLEEDRRPGLHLEAGRMLKNLPESRQGDTWLFDVAGHMMRGAARITDAAERLAVARLILEAGKKAKLSTAFADAAEHLAFARTLLPEDAWKRQYELAMSVNLELAEALYLAAEYEAAETCYREIRENLARDDDLLKLYNIQAKQYHHQARFAEAVEIEFMGLSLLGLDIPREDEALMPVFERENQRIAALLNGKSPAFLFDNPENKGPVLTRQLELLFDLFADSYLIGRGLLCGLSSAIMARLSMEKGNNPMASVSYINYASTICSMGADYPTGYAFGELAVRLAEKYRVPPLQNYTYHVFSLAVNHWKNPLSLSHQYWTEASKLSLATGSPYAGYVFLQLAHVLFASGAPLKEVKNQIDTSFEFLNKSGLDAIVTLLTLIVIQPVAHVTGKTRSMHTLDDDTFDTAKMLSEVGDLPFFTGSLYYAMLRVDCLSGNRPSLADLAERMDVIDNTQQGQIILADSYFYYTLILMDALAEEDADGNENAYREGIRAGREKMTNWADLNETNFRHKHTLIRAEEARLVKDPEKAAGMAVTLYDQAIAEALGASFIQDAALAAEKAGLFWLSRKKSVIAKAYFEQALAFYDRWGATAKTREISELFREHFKQSVGSGMTFFPEETTTLISETTGITRMRSFSEELDLVSVIKATQAVSRHIVLDDLAQELTAIAAENAGAAKGVMILKKGDAFVLASIIRFHGDKHRTGPETGHVDNLPLYRSDEVSPAVVNYVMRTKETVVLDHAARDRQFSQCRYIREKAPVSVCCIPIIFGNEIRAVLYLENNKSPGAFYRERLQTLHILAAQAAITMENALVYQDLNELNRNLEQKVRERTLELHDKNQELNQKNLDLKRLSTTDQLTGIFNRRRLEEMMTESLYNCERYDKSMAVILMDLDNFKGVNDTFGHNVGDAVLIRVAEVISANIRKTDIFGRWGGEEFLILVPEFTRNVMQIAEKQRAALEATRHPKADRVTASMGVAVYKKGDTASSLVSRADDALYMAKENGRNRVAFKE